LGGTSNHRFNLTNATGAVKRSQSGTNEILVQSVAGLASDMKMSITDGNGNTVGFQVINSGSPSILEAERVAMSVDLATVPPTSFATALAAAINQAVRDLRLKLPTATVASNAVTVRADDEDGVDFVGVFNAVYNAGTAAVGGRPATPGVPVAVSLTASSTGFVDAWIDWNQDNDFEDVGERILNALPVIAGVNTFFVSTPASAAVGYTTARFRLSSTGGLFTNGVGIGGEVEDHLIEVLAGSPPVAVNDAYTVNENGRLSSILSVLPKGVLANDYDADDPTDALPNDIRVYDENRTSTTDVSIQPLVAPRFGDLVLNPDGSFTYTPNPHFNGVDSFVYRTTDSRMVSANTATVTLTVHKVNDDPKAFDDVRTIDEDTIVEWTWANLTANDFAGITTLPQTMGDPVGAEILGYDSINVDPLTGRAPLLTGASDRGLGSERDQNLNIVGVRLLTPARLNPDERIDPVSGQRLENVKIEGADEPDRNNRKIR
ncbi:MAG: Ig-like domain-containing protein, partial [Planctomycetota bacterium]